MLFQEGAVVGTHNNFIIYSTPLGSTTQTSERVRITIIDTSPKYKIEKTRNDVISFFDYPDGLYDIKNTTLIKAPLFQVYIQKVKEEPGIGPALYTIDIIVAGPAKRGGNSFRHVSRKRKNNRRLGSKKRLSVNQRRSRRVRRVRRVRRSRKN